MGAWGMGSFDNDDASDWLAEFEERGSDAVVEALKLADADEYLEAPEGSILIASAEIVASAFGSPAPNLSEEALAAVSKFSVSLKSQSNFPSRSILALARVLASNSELQELWQESDDYDTWKQNIEALALRLKKIA